MTGFRIENYADARNLKVLLSAHARHDDPTDEVLEYCRCTYGVQEVITLKTMPQRVRAAMIGNLHRYLARGDAL